jgi:hypothetical protein
MPDQAFLKVDEKSGSLFQPDTLIAYQYFNTVQKKSALEPEKRLMLAVFEDAIRCFQRYVHAQDEKGRKLFREAEEWISEKNTEWAFSFEQICEVSGFDPNYLRKMLMQWKRRKSASSKKVHRLIAKRQSEKFGRSAFDAARCMLRKGAGG